jgi:hypothetical protein
MAEILKLTNSLDEVNLLDPATINLIEWEPALPTFKEQTVSSMYQDGKSLVSRLFDNVTETFRLYIVGQSTDDTFNNLRVLISILEKGLAFYTGVVSTPTYLSVKGDNETNPRYAIVKNWRIEKIPHYLQNSRFQAGASSAGVIYANVLVEISLVLELSLYRDIAPGEQEDSLALGKNTFNGRTYGTVSSTEANDPQSIVPVSTSYTQANFTHIFRYDASSASFSSNLIDASLPYNLFPNPIGNGDIIYFGIQASATGSRPVHNVVLDLTPATDEIVGNWEQYSDGGGFAATPNGDQIGRFSVGGVVSQHVGYSDLTTINGVNGYWLRFVITNTNGVTTPPQQKNRRPYAVTWPYIEVPDTQVTGDVTALFGLEIKAISQINRLIGGLRDTSRGSNFSAYINLSDTGNPSGINVTTSESFEDTPDFGAGTNFFEAGKAILVERTAADADYVEIASVVFDDPSSFSGKFRVIVCIETDNSAGFPDVLGTMYLAIHPRLIGSSIFNSQPKSFSAQTSFMVDLGEIDFSPGLKRGQGMNYLELRLHCKVTGESFPTQFFVTKLLVIPCDEWSFDWFATESFGVLPGESIQVDPSLPPEHVVQITNDSAYVGSMIPIMITPPMLSSNTTQRIWFAAFSVNGDNEAVIPIVSLFEVRPHIFSRYLVPRGSA